MVIDKVEDYCKTAGLTVARFEKLCGIGNGAIGRWKTGKASPSLASLLKIEKATGIPVFMWLDEGAEL